MDTAQEGYILIGTTMLIMLAFLVALLLIMIIYRRRKMEHIREVDSMKEKYQKEMLEAQVEIQQDIMQQIGQEIHDNVGQKLTLATLYTEHIKLGEKTGSAEEKIASISALINESLAELRNLSKNLTQPPDGQQGLDILLQKELNRVKLADACHVHFNVAGKPHNLSMKVNNMIIRIVQEFLQNSIKHAGCGNIHICIFNDDTGFTMEMADDGKGFVTEQKMGGKGIGIANMKKRAVVIGADLQLDSIPGSGTSMRLFIPAEKTT